MNLFIKEKKSISYIILFRIMYDIVSLNFFATAYDLKLEIIRYIMSWIIFLIILFLQFSILKKSISFSDNVINILTYIYLVPTMSLIGTKSVPFEYTLLISFYWIFIIIFQSKIPVIKINKNKDFSFLLYPLVAISVIVILVFTYQYNGLSFDFDLSDTYEVRKIAELANISYLIEILRTFVSMFLFPICIMLSLYTKRWMTAFFFVFMQLLTFSIAMDKINLFLLPICIGYFIAYSIISSMKRRDSLIDDINSILLIFSNFIGILETIIFKTSFIADYVIRRLFLVPSVLNYIYFDLMKTREKIYFREGLLLNRFFAPVHGKAIQRIVSEVYFDGITHPNNGMFSEAFTQFGWSGIIILPALLIIVLRAIDSIAYDIPVIIYNIASISLSVVLLNVNLNSGRIIYSVILLWITFYFLDFEKLKEFDHIKQWNDAKKQILQWRGKI